MVEWGEAFKVTQSTISMSLYNWTQMQLTLNAENFQLFKNG